MNTADPQKPIELVCKEDNTVIATFATMDEFARYAADPNNKHCEQYELRNDPADITNPTDTPKTN